MISASARSVSSHINQAELNGRLPDGLSVVPIEPAGFPDGIASNSLTNQEDFVAVSSEMRKVRAQVLQIASLDIPVLILGESGTGKEVVARMIHKESHRAHRTFMRVNCAALPAELLESELFGHEAGAFTGATRAKPGKFESCQRGTILLDEIAEMPIGPQAKFLHILQDGEFARLGSPFPRKVDVRVLAATNINVQQAIASKQFRLDLYYRLSAYSIYLPPLRERRADIAPLIDHFTNIWIKRLGRSQLPMSRSLMNACMHYNWPGNVRELENIVKRWLICEDESQALRELNCHSDVRSHISVPEIPSTPGDLKSQLRRMKRDAEKEAIIYALKMSKGSRKEAARMLNISIRALQYKMTDCEIDRRTGAAISEVQ